MPATEESQNRLFKAAEAGDVQEFQEAAAAIDEDVRELHADNGANVLHIAAHAGHTELCAYLLDDLHLDVNATDGKRLAAARWLPLPAAGRRRRQCPVLPCA